METASRKEKRQTRPRIDAVRRADIQVEIKLSAIAFVSASLVIPTCRPNSSPNPSPGGHTNLHARLQCAVVGVGNRRLYRRSRTINLNFEFSEHRQAIYLKVSNNLRTVYDQVDLIHVQCNTKVCMWVCSRVIRRGQKQVHQVSASWEPNQIYCGYK